MDLNVFETAAYDGLAKGVRQEGQGKILPFRKEKSIFQRCIAAFEKAAGPVCCFCNMLILFRHVKRFLDYQQHGELLALECFKLKFVGN